MFPVTITLSNVQQLNAVMAALNLAGGVNAQAAAAQANEAAMADTVEAPGKPSAARTARSPRTAEAAPSTPAPSGDAPEPKAESSEPAATAQTADASSASQAAEPFDYALLAKAVNAAVPKHGKDKLVAIAKKHGADSFKVLPNTSWAAAHADVVALG